jgi:hypothetical protein
MKCDLRMKTASQEQKCFCEAVLSAEILLLMCLLLFSVNIGSEDLQKNACIHHRDKGNIDD